MAAASNSGTGQQQHQLPRRQSYAQLQHQQHQSTSTSYHGTGTIAQMEELYEVGDVIGTGTFGIIRKVIRRTDGLVLARKELDYGRMDERDLKQLSEEVNILQNLEPNENIVRYYERYVDRQKYRLHIIMEFCHNGDLAAQIQRCRRKNTLLREDIVWSYLTQIALALADCHAQLDAMGKPKQVILHRDIKPENVFLDKDNIIKLGDFGLSKAMQSAAFTNTYVGTPYYMSPELINSQAYDVKSDIWALGCLIYELCAWHPPFHEARTQAELTKLIRDGRIPPLPPGYSRNLQELIKSMLRQDPKQRPTIEQIRSVDEVKFQMRVIEMRRMHEELVRARREVETRELALSERERAVSVREREMEQERVELVAERQRLAAAFVSVSAYSSSSSGTSVSGTSTAPSSRDNSPMMEQKENISVNMSTNSNVVVLPPSVSTATVATMTYPEMGSVNEKTIARVASRPSLVPRRPLEERRSMVGLNTLSKRLSSCSLQTMMVDGETPVKATPGTEARRKIATSKSMHNLKSSASSQLSSPTPRFLPSLPKYRTSSIASSEMAGSTLASIPQSASAVQTTFNTSSHLPPGYPTRPASSSAVELPGTGHSYYTTRSNSAQANPIHSPSKRPLAPSRTTTAPPSLSTASSMSALSSLANHILPGRYNLDDEESLPSPFIKKKASGAGPLRAIAAAQEKAAQQAAGMTTRSASSASLSSVANGGAPAVPSRTGRPSTTRQSLGARLAMARQAKVDEQGRKSSAVA